MLRRDLLGMGIAVGAVWPVGPVAAQVQGGRKYRLGFLGGTADDQNAQRIQVDPFMQGMRELGYVEGRNLEIHFRWAEGKPDRLPGLLDELLKLNLDALVTAGPRPAVVAKNATTTLPVIALGVDNPAELGATHLARPSANVTGITSFAEEVVAKRLQLLKELVPSVRRVAVLMNPVTASRTAMEPDLRRFGERLGLSIQLVEAAGPDRFDAAFDAISREQAEGILVLADATFWTHRARLHELVAKHRLPSIWGGRDYLDGGGLASYQADWPAIFRRGAHLVDRILKGAEPGVTPFEQATKLDLAINLKAAQAMGLTVPQSVLLAADHVIR